MNYIEKSKDLIENPINWEGIRNKDIDQLKERLKTISERDLGRMLIILESESTLLEESNKLAIFLGLMSFLLGLSSVIISILNYLNIISSLSWIIIIGGFLLILIIGSIYLGRKRTGYRNRNKEIISIRIAVEEVLDEKLEEKKEKANREKREKVKSEKRKTRNRRRRRKIRRIRQRDISKTSQDKEDRQGEEANQGRRPTSVIDEEISGYIWREKQ